MVPVLLDQHLGGVVTTGEQPEEVTVARHVGDPPFEFCHEMGTRLFLRRVVLRSDGAGPRILRCAVIGAAVFVHNVLPRSLEPQQVLDLLITPTYSSPA